jgi:hypothetical protein
MAKNACIFFANLRIKLTLMPTLKLHGRPPEVSRGPKSAVAADLKKIIILLVYQEWVYMSRLSCNSDRGEGY